MVVVLVLVDGWFVRDGQIREVNGDGVSRPVRIGRRHAQVFGETIYISRFGIWDTMYLYLYLYDLKIGRNLGSELRYFNLASYQRDHMFVFTIFDDRQSRFDYNL